ncbi:hypothetical protein AAE478_004003, partial [Parahypoxylon ruwenzoriense]
MKIFFQRVINGYHVYVIDFTFWQLACLVQRRWPEWAGAMRELAEAFQNQIGEGERPPRAFCKLLGSDYGDELKTLIRVRRRSYGSKPLHDDSAIGAALAPIPFQYCPEQDTGLLK